MQLWVACLFAVSGCAGLIFEALWTRQLALVFGSTVHSASLTAGIFLLGLGIGARLGHRLSKATDLLRRYALLEAFVGVVGMLVTYLIPLASAPASSAASLAGDSIFTLTVIRCFTAALLLGPPCVAMGASLPVLCAYFTERLGDRFLQSLSWLYAVNTLGAVAGVVCTDWLLVPHFGIIQSGACAAGLDLMVAALAWRLAQSSPATPQSNRQPESTAMHWTVWGESLTILLGLGFAGTTLQVSWTRCLIIFHGSDLRAFSACLATYLAALGIGAWVAGRVKNAPAALLAVLIAASVTTQLSLFTLGSITEIDSFLSARLHVGETLRQWLGNWMIILPAALCLGMAFPLATASANMRRSEPANLTAWALLFNTLGSISGALFGGFVLLPLVGLQGTLGAASVLLALLGCLAAQGFEKRVGVATFVGALLFLNFSLPHTYLRQVLNRDPSQRIFFWGEDSYGTVALATELDSFTGREVVNLLTDGFNMMGNSLLGRRYATMISAMPILLQERPGDVLVICFGLAHTLNAALELPSTSRVDCVELSPTVLRAVSQLPQGRQALQNPKLRVKIGDGRHHLLTTNRRYAAIVAEPPPPTHAGVVNLYTRQYYQLCRGRLEPGGMVVQWLPIYQMSKRDAQSIIRAFVDTFPSSYLLEGSKSNLLLLGMQQPLKLDYTVFSERVRDGAAVLAPVGLGRPEVLLSSILAGPATLAKYTAAVPPLEDNRPLLQYSRRAQWEPDFAFLLMTAHPHEVELVLSADPILRAKQERELKTAWEGQRALRRYLYTSQIDPAIPETGALRKLVAGRTALRAFPGDPYAEEMLLVFPDFQRRLEQAVESGSAPSALWANLSRVHFLQSRPALALQCIRRARSLKDEPLSLAMEILMLRELGEASAAAELWRKSGSALAPADREYLRSLAP